MSGGAPPPTPQHRAARAARAWNVHRLVGLRVTPLARLAPLRVERPEVHQRDLVAVCNRLNNDVQRCRARRCATLGARVGQDGTRASQSSAVQTGQVRTSSAGSVACAQATRAVQAGCTCTEHQLGRLLRDACPERDRIDQLALGDARPPGTLPLCAVSALHADLRRRCAQRSR